MAARKLTVYGVVRAELAAFEKEYKSIVVECDTPEGMKSAKACRKEIRDARSNLEDLRKEAKAPVLEKGTQIDTEAKAIKEKLDALFTKFDDGIKAIENKKAIEAARVLAEEGDRLKALEAREQAIFDKEVELGIRPAPEPEQSELPVDATDDDDTSDSSDDGDSTGSVGNTVSQKAETDSKVSVICEPHIKVAAERLHALKAIRNLVEPTDAQPDGSIDEKIAINHDAVLADIWEIVDVFQ